MHRHDRAGGPTTPTRVSARLRQYLVPIGTVLLLGCSVIATRHYGQFLTGQASAFIVVATLSFTWLTLTLWCASTHEDVLVEDDVALAKLARLRVTVVMPVYNEDPETFRRAIATVAAQTRRVQRLHVVDDGSSDRSCGEVMRAFAAEHPWLEAVYTYVPNNGKREAQAVAFRADPDADVYVTVDSDTLLDPRAVEHGLMPFVDRRVMSVAGFLVGLNRGRSLLTRLTDLGYTVSTLNTRAFQSRLGSVCVNQGPLAFYRGFVPHKYLEAYLGHTFMGRRVVSGDDRMLTNFALMEGRTVLQQSALAATLLPTSIGHLTRQRIRWSRSFFRGGMWLIRHLPATRLAWWIMAWRYTSFCMFTVMYPTVLLIQPVHEGYLPVAFFVYICLLSYAKAVRYLTVGLVGESRWSRVLTYLLAPASTLLHFYLSTVLKYAGLATVRSTGWGTRSSVEVGLAQGGAPKAAVVGLR